jgi:hypothetical protein
MTRHCTAAAFNVCLHMPSLCTVGIGDGDNKTVEEGASFMERYIKV